MTDLEAFPGADLSMYPYQLGNHADAMRWLLCEMGARGLSGLFRRGDQVVYTSLIDEAGYIEPPKDDDSNGPSTVRPANADTIVARLALNYHIHKLVKDGDALTSKEVFFPTNAAKFALHALDRALNLRSLRGVSHTPLARADGSILDTPGYDTESGFLFLPTIDVPPVPARPTPMQLRAATRLLRGLVSEFVWAGEHDEANYHGLNLTPLLRLVCPPPYKQGAIMARQPGSGKSLLARIIRETHGGVFRSEMPHDDAELAKSIASILACTTAAVCQWDNISGVLRSSRLAGLLTSAEYSDRLLGSSNNTPMTNDRLWILTGNNLSLGGDLVRRTLWVTIDPKVPNPEKRTGFKLDIPAYLAEHRAEILHALLTWIAAWHAENRPTPPRRSSDDYAHWVATVNGILRVAGVPGEFDHQDSAQQKTGTDDEGWGEFLTAIHHVYGDQPFLVRELLTKVHDGREDHQHLALTQVHRGASYADSHPIPLEALPSELAEKFLRHGPAGAAKSLGCWLKFRNGRFAGDLVCEMAGPKKRDGQRWQVRKHRESDAA